MASAEMRSELGSLGEGGVVIRTPDQRLRVFVSSTLGELAPERRAVARAISSLRLTPVLFELGARPHPPRDRGRAVNPGFAITRENAEAVVEVCRRLEGLPLAIELAAARTRLLAPGALLARLASSLDVLGHGAVDMPERQRTLRATVKWSVGLLDDAERSLLEIVAVFVDGWTIEAASQVAHLDEDRALDLTEALARHSLVQVDSTRQGPRSRMLETVREFVAERLAARPDAATIKHPSRRVLPGADRAG